MKILDNINKKYKRTFLAFSAIGCLLTNLYWQGGYPDYLGSKRSSRCILSSNGYDGDYRIKCKRGCPQTYKEAKDRITKICIWYVLILLLFYKEIRNFFLYKIYYPDRGILPKSEDSKPKKLSGKIDTKNFKS